MTAHITGVFKDPLRNPLAKVTFRFTAITTEGGMLEGVDVTTTVGSDGTYAFDLNQGRYLLEVLYTDEYIEVGRVLVDENTPSDITLEQLIRYATPYEAPLLLEGKPDWDTLFQDTQQGDTLDRSEQEQVRDESLMVSEGKDIYKNDDALLAKEAVTTSTGSSATEVESLAYEDGANQKAAMNGVRSSLSESEAVSTQEVYQNSDGSQEAISRVKLDTPDGSLNQISEVSGEKVGSTVSAVRGVATAAQETLLEDEQGGAKVSHTSEAGIAQGIHEASITSTDEVKYVEASELVEALMEKGIKIKYSKPDGFPMEYFDRLQASKDGGTKTTQVDRLLVQARDGFPVMDIDTENRAITLDAKLTFQNTDDFIGESGWTYGWEFQFSKDKGLTDPWHDEYDALHPDVWRKDQQVKWQGDEKDNYQNVGLAEIIKLNAEDGLAGDNFYMEEQYTTLEEYPNGWRDSFASGDDWRRWRTVRIGATGSAISAWTESPLKGTDGPAGWVPEIETYYGRSATATFDKTNPANTYGDWSKNLTDSDVYKYERTVWWMSSADFAAARNAGGGIDWSIAPEAGLLGDWIGPTKFKPVKGEDYFDGESGEHGVGSYIFRSSSYPTNDSQIDSAVLSVTPNVAPANGFTATWITNAGTKYYLRTGGTASTSSLVRWTPFDFVWDGNVIVDGTLVAKKLKAKTITADYIDATDLHVQSANVDGELTASQINTDGLVVANVQTIGPNTMFISSETPFGPDNLLEWRGPKYMNGSVPNYSYLSKSRATYWYDSNNSSYFGGGISAGILKNGNTNTSLTAPDINSYPVTVGPFGTSGRSKSIIVSFNMEGTFTYTGVRVPSDYPESRFGWTLERKIGSGGWAAITSGYYSSPVTCNYEQETNKTLVLDYLSGSSTYNDQTASTSNFSYRLKVTSYYRSAYPSVQTISVLITEE